MTYITLWADPARLFVEVWEEVQALYEDHAGLEAKTVFAEDFSRPKVLSSQRWRWVMEQVF